MSLGPEIYHFTRVRKGGTEQGGVIKGVRFTYDRIKAYSWYLGVDLFASEGRLTGHNSKKKYLCSTLNDRIYEGRLGVTFQQQTASAPFITPFAGYGSFRETNDFKKPSPITFTFVDTFNYVVGGFLSGINFTPLLSMGLNFKVEFMLNGKSHVKNDPLNEELYLSFKNEINTRLEVPLIYRFCFLRKSFSIILAPFYEFRHFGGQEGFPFDFIDTKFYLVGARGSLGFAF